MEPRLDDPLWRLANLYSVKEADTGRVVPFVPRPEQMEIFRGVYERGERRIVILKARRLGMSTGIDIMLADAAIWAAGLQASIVDLTQDDASEKIRSKVKIAFDGLPAPIRERAKVIADGSKMWGVQMEDDAASYIYGGKNARGGTNQFLHVSEWGPIQAEDPRRSEEVLTGALPSAEHGVVIVETTWKGGKSGHLWGLIEPALNGGQSQWKVYFFPWFVDPTYVLEEGEVDDECSDYLDTKEQELGVTFSSAQRRWYADKRRELGVFIFREFPTTIDECFRAPVDGAIYAPHIDRQRARGWVEEFEPVHDQLVHTFWDLGAPENMVVWYVQLVGQEIHVIDIDLNLGLNFTTTQRVAHMRAKGYLYGSHFLPHDGGSTQKGGRSYAQELQYAGLPGVRIVPRTIDPWIGINRVIQLIPRMRFRIPQTQDGLDHLDYYHTKRETSGGLAVDHPVHDWSSHAADAIRTFGEASMHGMLEGMSAVAKEHRRKNARAKVGYRG